MSIDKMNAIFKKAYKEFLETGKMSEPTLEQLEERKRREEVEKYIDSLPNLSAGTYKVKLLKDLVNLGNDTDTIIKEAEGVDFSNAEQATDFYRKFVKPKITDIIPEVTSAVLSYDFREPPPVFKNT